MKNILLFAFSLLQFVTVNAQIVFFGKSEPIRTVNSASGENYLFLDFDNSEMYLTREKHPGNKHGVRDAGDIWLSRLDSTWSEPELLKINDKDFAAPAGRTPDGQYLLFHRVEYDKGVYNGSVLAFSGKRSVEPLNIPYFKNISPIQTGNLSKDGKYLMLSMENKQGYGVDDLFVCELQSDGSWSAPKNLGNVVNTEFQEITPFLAADNKTMYFSSNGRRGAGSFDIYQTKRLDDTWQNWSIPKSVGIDVNTEGAETSFMFDPDAEYAYYVSTQNSDGYGDVRRIKISTDIKPAQELDVVQLRIAEIREQSDTLNFLLVDKRKGTPIQGEALWVVGGDTIEMFSNNDGLISLVKGEELRDVEFKSKGYLSTRLDVSGQALNDVMRVSLEPLETGNVITLDHVLFYRGTANFVEGSQDELDLVVEMMNENPEVKIFLKGHTDNVGNSVLNIQLSRERVLTVEEYLFDKGIARDRITGDGFGGEKPIASNDTEATRKLNRRVEFEVIRD
ncbi:MAG: OmpA family protein [Cyclobacteriaceae bacterium]